MGFNSTFKGLNKVEMRIKHGEIRNVYKNGGKLHTAGWLERSTPVSGDGLH
jgi:hypothetical protein